MRAGIGLPLGKGGLRRRALNDVVALAAAACLSLERAKSSSGSSEDEA
ncbi:hypothetical protein [Azospirillum argentinense]